MTIYLTAIVMGLMSGGHCIGMCGPLVLALPVDATSHWRSVLFRIVYNSGRITVYAGMGAVVGLTAAGLELKLLQKHVAHIAGAILITISVLQLLPFFQLNILSALHARVSAAMRRVTPREGVWRFWFLGMVNGFLPCGMVAAALIAALSLGEIPGAVFYMLLFGLGTFPLMLAASLFGVYLSPKVRRSLAVVGPLYGIALGVLLVVRPGLIHPNCH
jgi:sulfite exporter TauE/SafE